MFGDEFQHRVTESEEILKAFSNDGWGHDGASIIWTLSKKQSGPYPDIKLNLIIMLLPKEDKLILSEVTNDPGVVFVAPSLDSRSVPDLYHTWVQDVPLSSETRTSKASFG